MTHMRRNSDQKYEDRVKMAALQCSPPTASPEAGYSQKALSTNRSAAFSGRDVGVEHQGDYIKQLCSAGKKYQRNSNLMGGRQGRRDPPYMIKSKTF